jgi:hypothetical protein
VAATSQHSLDAGGNLPVAMAAEMPAPSMRLDLDRSLGGIDLDALLARLSTAQGLAELEADRAIHGEGGGDGGDSEDGVWGLDSAGNSSDEARDSDGTRDGNREISALIVAEAGVRREVVPGLMPNPTSIPVQILVTKPDSASGGGLQEKNAQEAWVRPPCAAPVTFAWGDPPASPPREAVQSLPPQPPPRTLVPHPRLPQGRGALGRGGAGAGSPGPGGLHAMLDPYGRGTRRNRHTPQLPHAALFAAPSAPGAPPKSLGGDHAYADPTCGTIEALKP